jgi:acetyltransferase-like isoleucine patch superfamily enzyme
MNADVQTWLWRLAMSWVVSEMVPWWMRPRLLRLLGCRVAAGVVIHSGARIISPNLVIAPGVLLNYECLLDNQEASITIGERTYLGERVTLMTMSHVPDRWRSGPANTTAVRSPSVPMRGSASERSCCPG